MLDACPLTEVGKRLLQPLKSKTVSVIEPTSDADSSGAGPIPAASMTLEAEEASRIGEQLCQKSALDWAKLQQEDLMSRTVIQY